MNVQDDARSNTSPQLPPMPLVSDLETNDYASKEDLVKAIVQSIKLSGGCVIRHMLSQDKLDEMEVEVIPHLNTSKPHQGDFWPPQTGKVMGLMGKSKAFALNIVGNEIWQSVGEHFLTSKLEHNWVGDTQEKSISKPQLNNTVVFSIGPGGYAQKLHRDDPVHHTFLPASASHYLGRDNGIGFFVAGKRSTRENGATRFVPGSHLWDYAAPPPPDDSQSFWAELQPGDGFMILSGCYHGGSANTTDDEERLLYSTFTTRGFLRQEENQYLACDVKKILELPLWLQRFSGYELSKPFMGWVEMDDPMRVIHPEMESMGDLW